jgi:hypothetical protein
MNVCGAIVKDSHGRSYFVVHPGYSLSCEYKRILET